MWGGRLVYFAGNEFPEFKKEVLSLFRREFNKQVQIYLISS